MISFFAPPAFCIKSEVYDVVERYSIRRNQASKRRTNEFLSRNLLLCSRWGLSRFCRLKLTSRSHYGIITMLLFQQSGCCLDIRDVILKNLRVLRKPAYLNNYIFTPSKRFIIEERTRFSPEKWRVCSNRGSSPRRYPWSLP